MSITAARKTTIVFSGDLAGTNEYEADDNVESPGQMFTYTFTAAATNGTVFVPPGTEANATVVPTCLTILKPSDYTGTIILKTLEATPNDEGIPLHPTDPDSISIAATVTQFCIVVSEDVALRLLWT